MSSRKSGATPVNGFLNLYKPVGVTSMEALRRAKHITGQRKKVGHAGTIDPLAEGVLPICFGQATRLMERVVSGRKRYRMTVRLGATSTTYDAEGDIDETGDPQGLTRSDIAAALVPFVGRIDQVPPMYSALKVNGQRLYDLARSGQEIQRDPRTVMVYAIRIDRIELPELQLTIDCGKGTYLRSIAHDLGQSLDCGGYITKLARLSCGQFTANDGITLETLADAAANGDWTTHLHPIDWVLQDHAPMIVPHKDERAIRHGQAIRAEPGPAPYEVKRAYTVRGVFLALLQFQSETGCWQPIRVFQDGPPSRYAPQA